MERGEFTEADILSELKPDLFGGAQVVGGLGSRHRLVLVVGEIEFSKISGAVERDESVTTDSGERPVLFRKLGSIIDLEVEIQHCVVNLVVLNGGEESVLQR